jgi:hypothetical protein
MMASVPDYLLIETGFTIAQWTLVAPLTVLSMQSDDVKRQVAGVEKTPITAA